MTGEELYAITYEQARAVGYPLPAWRDLSPATRAEWIDAALEQTERDLENDHEALAVLDNLEER